MQNIFFEVRGDFGRVVVAEVTQDLVTHAHAEIHLQYWLAGGSARCKLGAENASLNERMIVACNSYQSHDMVLSNRSQPPLVMQLYIDLDWVDAIEQGWDTPVYFHSAQLTSTREIDELCEVLKHKIMSATEINERSLKDDLVNLLRLTVDQSNITPRNKKESVRRRMPDYRVRQVLAYMRVNINNMTLMNHMATEVGLSRSRLYELFMDEIQSSPKVIWNSMRLDEAMKRIVTTKESMASVGKAVGFSSAGNFSRFFKTNIGLSPLSYRKMLRSKEIVLPASPHARVNNFSNQTAQRP
jgi:AraC-like DNA-binding protein